MGRVIKFPKGYQDTGKKSRRKTFGTLGGILGAAALFCGITGFTLKDMFPEKDWQETAERYNSEALAYYESGDYACAVNRYGQAIALEDRGIANIAVCYYNRGRAYFKLGEYEKAVGDFTEAIRRNPKPKYYAERANAYDAMGDTANAMLDNVRAAASFAE